MFMKLGTNDWTARRWVFFQRLLGLYCLVHYAILIPWSMELFSNAGIFPDAGVSPLLGFLPNPLHLFDQPWMAAGMCCLGAVSGLALMFGRSPRLAAVIAWYVGACLLAKTPLILNPAMPHVGWTLLWFAAVPTPKEGEPWHLPKALYAAAWLLMGVVMTWSAATKLGSVSWMDGSALHWLWENPLARDTAMREWLTSLPAEPVQLITWGTLLLEALILPVALCPKVRAPAWWLLLAMHIGLLMTVDFADLSTGMLVVHLSLFDGSFLPRRIREPLRSRGLIA